MSRRIITDRSNAFGDAINSLTLEGRAEYENGLLVDPQTTIDIRVSTPKGTGIVRVPFSQVDDLVHELKRMRTWIQKQPPQLQDKSRR